MPRSRTRRENLSSTLLRNLYAVYDYSSSSCIFMILFFSSNFGYDRGVLVVAGVQPRELFISSLSRCGVDPAVLSGIHKHCYTNVRTLQLVTTVLSAAKLITSMIGFLLLGRTDVTLFPFAVFNEAFFEISARNEHLQLIWSFQKFMHSQATQPLFKLLFLPLPHIISLAFPSTFHLLFRPEVNASDQGTGSETGRLGIGYDDSGIRKCPSEAERQSDQRGARMKWKQSPPRGYSREHAGS